MSPLRHKVSFVVHGKDMHAIERRCAAYLATYDKWGPWQIDSVDAQPVVRLGAVMEWTAAVEATGGEVSMAAVPDPTGR